MRRALVGLVWLAAVLGAAWLFALAAGVAGAALSHGSWLVAFATVVFDVVAYATVGAVLAIRAPGHRIGPLLIAAALLVDTTFIGFLLGASTTAAHGPGDAVAGWASLVGSFTIYAAIIVAGPGLALFVPDGRLPGTRWRWPVGLVAGLYVVGLAMIVGQPGPLGDSLGENPLGRLGLPSWPAGGAIAAATLPISLVLAVAAVVVRFRRSRHVERQQLKWFAAANVAFAACMTASFADGATEPTVFDIAAFASLSFPAIAIGLAVLRYRLYEIDRIISRTIGWALVTAILAAIFAGVVMVLQSLLAGVTQGQTLAVAASTLVAFAMFQRIRRRVQRVVDRRFDRARYDGERIANEFAERLRDLADLAGLRNDVLTTVGAALRPSATGLWIRGDRSGAGE